MTRWRAAWRLKYRSVARHRAACHENTLHAAPSMGATRPAKLFGKPAIFIAQLAVSAVVNGTDNHTNVVLEVGVEFVHINNSVVVSHRRD